MGLVPSCPPKSCSNGSGKYIHRDAKNTRFQQAVDTYIMKYSKSTKDISSERESLLPQWVSTNIGSIIRSKGS